MEEEYTLRKIVISRIMYKEVFHKWMYRLVAERLPSVHNAPLCHTK